MVPVRVAVTGGEGLIGAAVGQALATRGIRVTSVDWRDGGTDVADARIVETLNAAVPDVVVHAAAHPGGRSLAEPIEDVRINALGSMRVFDWCARAKVPVVFTSSSIVYGEQPAGSIPETASLRPGTIYGVAKVACENWLAILQSGYGLEWTVLRLFATYGSGHRPNTYQGIVNVMLTQLLAGNRVVVRGSLDRQRDMIYVEDAAEAVAEAVCRPAARGQILNVGTGTAVTIRELIYTICHLLGRPLDEVEIVEEAGTIGDPQSNVADATKAATVLGFSSKFSITQGLQAVIKQRSLTLSP